ncbi:hypothetical protein L2K20_29650 [Mycobacterium sp. MBM]|nr:hypothetical protein [Mycobacterium sp. MBM]
MNILGPDDTGAFGEVFVILAILAVPLAAVFTAVTGALRDIGTVERFFARRDGIRQLPAGAIVDLTSAVRTARYAAWLRGSVQVMITVAVALGALWISMRSRQPLLVELLYLPAIVLLVQAVYMLILSRRRDARPWSRLNLLPALWAYLRSFGLLYSAIILSGFVATYFVILILAVFGAETGWVMPILLLIPVIVVVRAVGPRLKRILGRMSDQVRSAKRHSLRNIKDALARDGRPEVLLLRSFQDDRIHMRMRRSAMHSPLELATMNPFERFEELLSWVLWSLGPVCAIGEPGTKFRLPPIGAAREFHSDSEWQAAAEARMRSSVAVVMIAGRTPGIGWEVKRAMNLGVLHKCIFVIPPLPIVETERRLAVVAAQVGIRPQCLPSRVGKGRRVIGFRFDAGGVPVVYGVDGRTDIAYRVLLKKFAAELQEAPGTPLFAPSPGSLAITPVDVRRLLLPPGGKGATYPPLRVSTGLRMIARQLFQRFTSMDAEAHSQTSTFGSESSTRRRQV